MTRELQDGERDSDSRRLASVRVLAGVLLMLLIQTASSASFANAFVVEPRRVRTGGTSCALSSTLQSTAENVKAALKRPRGASIGAEFTPSKDLSDGDLSVLSMQLRKAAKSSAIWTSDAGSVAKLVKEQESSRGDFPGPLIVVYNGLLEEDTDIGLVCDASAVVLDYGAENNLNMPIIWRVNTLEHLKEIADESGDGVYLLSPNCLPECGDESSGASDALREVLDSLPNAVTVASLPVMQAANAEIQYGKHLAGLGIKSLILQNACVGDEEDVTYTQWAIEMLNKKASSSFSMTGLTGSANGHFGVASHSGEMKWRRPQ